jgi:hypothetical protein
VSVNNESGIVAYVNTPDLGLGFVQFARNRYSGNLNNKSFRINPGMMRSGEFGSLGDLQKAGADTGSIVAPHE